MTTVIVGLENDKSTERHRLGRKDYCHLRLQNIHHYRALRISLRCSGRYMIVDPALCFAVHLSSATTPVRICRRFDGV
jgi:hypothetical protein